MSQDLLERARESRKSPAALKVKVSNLRSRYASDPIFLVEGVDDVGVYETWLQPYANGRFLVITPGAGKEQLLGFRKILGNDQTGLVENIYFFVDRDYDGLQDQKPGPDIFCTDRYSAENYLGTILVCQSIIRDELRIDASSALFTEIVSLFEKSLDSLLQEMRHINFHIYCCRRLGVKLDRSIPTLTDIVQVSLGGVAPLSESSALLKEKFSVERPITDDEKEGLSMEYSYIANLRDSRGKFIFQFFRKWFHCLADEIALHPNGAFIKEKVNSKFSPAAVTHRSCAARSERPDGFSEFARSVFE